MAVSSRNTAWIGVTGLVFLTAGVRDRFWPGHFTLNSAAPSRAEIGIALALGVFFLGFAAFRILRSSPHP